MWYKGVFTRLGWLNFDGSDNDRWAVTIINRLPRGPPEKFHGERRIVPPGVLESRTFIAVISSFDNVEQRWRYTRGNSQRDTLATHGTKSGVFATRSFPSRSRLEKRFLLLQGRLEITFSIKKNLCYIPGGKTCTRSSSVRSCNSLFMLLFFM